MFERVLESPMRFNGRNHSMRICSFSSFLAINFSQGSFQQTFVLIKTFYVFVFRKRLQDVFKTSWLWRIYSPYSYVFRRRLQDVLITTNIFVLVIRLQDSFKTFWRRLQEIFKASSVHLQYVFKTSWRCLQDVLKTYYQVKLLLVTQFQDIFETYSKVFWDVLLRRLSKRGLPRSQFWEIYGQCTQFSRVISFSSFSFSFYYIF